jgi:hypothetical protein
MLLSREPSFLENGDLAQRVKALVFIVLGGVAIGREFELQSDLELFFAEILIPFKKMATMRSLSS